ncbi:MAG TPA: hypothetical protein GX704_00415 [Clostridiales bacterium]|nr:hypothetical protein [Clostridiales bacterium]
MYNLYGDGINDDYPAIQRMLDSGTASVNLPPPEKCYLLSKTLKIHSNQELILPRFARIRLADSANCCMLENAEPRERNENIRVSGGIWDMNHKNQHPNPYHFPNPITGEKFKDTAKRLNYNADDRLFIDAYTGHCFRFNSVKNLIFENLTIVNPVVYGAQFAFVEDFTVRDLVFDYTEGSPRLWNLDGIHFEGGCRNGYVKNLKGACHDDLVAITSDDGKNGDIENIVVDGIFAYGSHSAVRLLSVKHKVRNIHISNVYGTFYVYLVCLSKYYDTPGVRGRFENIYLNNISASFSEGTADVPGHWGALINIDGEIDVNNLVITDLVREESICAQPTISVGAAAAVRDFVIDRVTLKNSLDETICLLKNDGNISNLSMDNIRLCGNSKI